MAGFKESTEPVLQWVGDPSAPQQQKVASLTSRELDKSKMTGPKRH
jgi:hypothetical protein